MQWVLHSIISLQDADFAADGITINAIRQIVSGQHFRIVTDVHVYIHMFSIPMDYMHNHR